MQLKINKTKKINGLEKVELIDSANKAWKAILGTIFSILIIGTLGAVFLFTHISGVFDSSLDDNESVSSLILDRKNLNGAIEFAEEKRESLERAKENLPLTIDPSIVNGLILE